MQEQDPGMTEDQDAEEADLEDKREKLKWYQVVTRIGCGTLVFIFGLAMLVGLW